MRFSNSKLSSFLNNPMIYHLSYDLGIYPKAKPNALDLGSAVHWGLEHNTSDLDLYYQENQTLRSFKNSDSQILAEVMVESYLQNKEMIFDKILIDEKGYKLELLEEVHELELHGTLKTNVIVYEDNDFTGIIDLLLLTNKGFIIVDYKTSSKKPDFNQYLSQLYKYIYLCKSEFSDIPVYRIAIINLQKSPTKRKSNQTELEYRRILEKEYRLVGDNDDLIRVNVFDRDIISDEEIQKAIEDLRNQCDFVSITSRVCKNYNIFYTNWENANEYGGSPYLPLLRKEKNAYVLYDVKDKYLVDGQIVNSRPMRPIDIEAIDNPKYLDICRYDNYKKVLEDYEIGEVEDLMANAPNPDKELLQIYNKIYEEEYKAQLENKSK